MMTRLVGWRSLTLGDGTLTGPIRLGTTEFVMGILDDGDPEAAPVAAWLPTTIAPTLPSAPPPAPAAAFVAVRVESADDAQPLAWRVVPETMP